MQIKKLISGKQDAIKRVATTFDYYSDSIYVKYYSCWNLLFTILSNRESFRGVLLYLKVIRLIKFCVEEEKI